VGAGGDRDQAVTAVVDEHGQLDDHVVDAWVGDDDEQVAGVGGRQVEDGAFEIVAAQLGAGRRPRLL
jgi:hypothetical protein